jgi:hypothetical protein
MIHDIGIIRLANICGVWSLSSSGGWQCSAVAVRLVSVAFAVIAAAAGANFHL